MPRDSREARSESSRHRRSSHDTPRPAPREKKEAQARAEDDERRPRRAGSQAAERNEDEREDRTDRGHTRQHSAITAGQSARYAAEHVAGLTGRQPESVTSVERTDNGWCVGIEVVESRRIPDSTDILAVYRVEVDDGGELISYRRAERYYRGRAEEK